MAKSKFKGSVQRVKRKEDRKQPGVFFRLKTDERFKANALFTPDPEAKNNPGYFEYYEHYDNANNSYVPCLGEDCFMCELGDSPSLRALTAWYFPDNPSKEKVKVFKLNGFLIRDFTEIDEEEGGVLGRSFRVKRLTDKGEYRATPQVDVKKLPKAEIKELVTELPDFQALLDKQAKGAYEKNAAAAAMSDTDDDDDEDEDDDEEETKEKKSKKGSPAADTSDDDDDDDDDDDEDEDEDEEKSDDDDDEDEDEDDEDEDEDDSKSDDEDEDESEQKSLKGQTFTVVKTDEDGEIITVDMDGTKTKVWVGEGLTVDWDEVKKGVEIKIDALTDDDGDWIATKVKAAKGKKDDKKKSSKKSDKKGKKK